MPQYTRLKDFMALVRAANPSYSNWVKSSLKPLEELLAKEDCSPQKVNHEIQRLSSTPDDCYSTKANRYKDALYFLECTYPGTGPVKVLSGGAGGASSAMMYLKTALEPTLQAAHPLFVNPVQAAHVRVGAPVEEFILGHPDLALGVLLIHLSEYQAAMDRTYCGWKAVDHMRSVLRVAGLRGLQVCVLHMVGPPVCARLNEVLQGCKAIIIHEPQHHSGFFNRAFDAFLSVHDAVVVLGFDADICVHANMFGTPDRLPDGTLPPALVNRVSVVTSRPLLVTTGTINKAEYGEGIHGT